MWSKSIRLCRHPPVGVQWALDYLVVLPSLITVFFSNIHIFTVCLGTASVGIHRQIPHILFYCCVWSSVARIVETYRWGTARQRNHWRCISYSVLGTTQSTRNRHQPRNALVRELLVLRRHAHESRRLWVKVRGFHKTQEQVADALAEGTQAGLPSPPTEKVRLPVYELRDVSGEAAVELAHRPLQVQQHVEALFYAQERSLEGFVQLL